MTDEEILRRVPPHSIEAEQAVLGAVFIRNEVLGEAVDIVTAEEFYREAHREIFKAMLELSSAGKAIDTITIPNRLRARNVLEAVGGPGYIAELAAIVPTAANIAHYARIVHDKARLRTLALLAGRIASECYDGPLETADFIDSAGAKIMAACADQTDRKKVEHIAPTLDAILAQAEKRASGEEAVGITTGLVDVDTTLSGGFRDGDVVIVAGRPSMGKTALAGDYARRFATQQKPVVFFSLEMSREQLAARLLCGEAPMDSERFLAGFIGNDEWVRIGNGAARLGALPLYIDDSSTLTPMQMRSRCRLLQQHLGEQKLAAIFVDYIGLMLTGTKDEQSEMAAISRQLKALAKEMRCPVFVLSQLNRQCEQREDKRPRLADLRASGALEQDADVVLFVYRHEYYKPDDAEPNVAEVIIGKDRNGAGAGKTVKLVFEKQYQRFQNYAKEQEMAA